MTSVHFINVITPVYNGQCFLEDYFSSLLQQNYENFEIIIVNDGSTDESEKIINKYINSSNLRIKYFFQQNQGIAAATRKGLELATSPYIVLMDQDDLASNNRLEKIAAAFSKGAELIMSAYEIIDHDKNSVGKKIVRFPKYVTEQNILSESLKRNYFLGSAMAFYYKGDFTISHYSGGVTDYDIALKMLVNDYRFKYIDDILLHYRVHSNNTSANYKITKTNALDVLEQYNHENLYDLLINKQCSVFESAVTIGILSLFKNKLSEAESWFLKAFEVQRDVEERVLIELYFYFSVTNYKLCEIDITKEYLEKLYSMGNNVNPSVLNNLGVLYAISRDIEKAKEMFEQALTKNMDFLDAKKNLENIQRNDTSNMLFTERLLREVLNHSNIIRE